MYMYCIYVENLCMYVCLDACQDFEGPPAGVGLTLSCAAWLSERGGLLEDEV